MSVRTFVWSLSTHSSSLEKLLELFSCANKIEKKEKGMKYVSWNLWNLISIFFPRSSQKVKGINARYKYGEPIFINISEQKIHSENQYFSGIQFPLSPCIISLVTSNNDIDYTFVKDNDSSNKVYVITTKLSLGFSPCDHK